MAEVERNYRRSAIVILGVMALIWIVLGGASFVSERGRPDPDAITFEGQNAVQGKRTFQAFNCMDCHTLVGNGAYFAPDLTFIYKKAGPAWLSAYLSSPGTWPTKPVVDLWIDRLHQAGAPHEADEAAYYRAYPGALKRVRERGGRRTLMPNLPFTEPQIRSLVAFLDYTSRLDTEGWPPIPQPTHAALLRETSTLEGIPGAGPAPQGSPAAGPAAAQDPVAAGRATAVQMGCLACHSINGTRLVGPTWKGLYGSAVPLADGTTVKADESYLSTSILDPNAQVVKSFPPSVMPPFKGRLSDQQVQDLVAYIQSLQ